LKQIPPHSCLMLRVLEQLKQTQLSAYNSTLYINLASTPKCSTDNRKSPTCHFSSTAQHYKMHIHTTDLQHIQYCPKLIVKSDICSSSSYSIYRAN
jgi:hypothetical protein